MTTERQTEHRIITAIGEDRDPILQEATIDGLLGILSRRADRLVGDRGTLRRVKPALRAFVQNLLEYFDASGELDDYTLTNLLTALATADNHGPGQHGLEDYSTLIRRPNPTHPDTDRYFVVGREGRITDPACPLRAIESNDEALAELPTAQLHTFLAFHYARSIDPARGAPRIPVASLKGLVPTEIQTDRALEEAFLDVCFSDGAWELYQRKIAA